MTSSNPNPNPIPNRNRRRTAQLNYTYNLDDRNGSLEIDSTRSHPVHIQYADHDVDSHRYALSLDHPNYLCLKMVHVRGNENTRTRSDRDTSDARPDIRVHQKPTKTCQDYIRYQLTNHNLKSVMLYNFHGDRATYYYVPEPFKMLIRGAVSLLLRIHEDDQALKCNALTLDNLRIGRKELVITGVDFVGVTSATKDGLFAQDWRFLRDLIVNHIFGNLIQRIPEDMTALLERMRYYHGRDDEKLFKHHLALMTSRERIDFVIYCSSKQRSLISRGLGNDFHKAVQRMGNYTGWKTNIFHNPNNPIFSVVQQCFTNPGALVLPQYDDTDPLKANYSIIKCARNIVSHLHEHFVLQHAFGDRELDIMLMATFGDAITNLHHMLSLENLLVRMIN